MNSKSRPFIHTKEGLNHHHSIHNTSAYVEKDNLNTDAVEGIKTTNKTDVYNDEIGHICCVKTNHKHQIYISHRARVVNSYGYLIQF